MTSEAWARHDPTACPTCGRDSCEDHLPPPSASAGPSPTDDMVDPLPVVDFQRRKKRIVPNSFFNIRLALAQLDIRLQYDCFARTVLMNDTPLDDVLLDQLWVKIDDTFGFRPIKSVLQTLLLVEAHARPRHPVVAYLASLRWDRIPRLDDWLCRYGGAVETAYTRAVGALPLIAAVRRVRSPGCKFDEMLVFESPQGQLKSSALRTLCPQEEWFSDDLPLGVASKEIIERTGGKWLVEASEMHGHRGREVEQLKAFLSRQADGPVRLAYGRLSTTVPRQFILIGTSNTHVGYLKDSTGGRRFWPVRVEQFDLAALERDRDQLWAEAAAREARSESIRLDSSLWGHATEQQELRRAMDPWEPILDPLFTGDGIVAVEVVPVSEIWAALGVEASKLDNRHADRVAAIAQRHGFTVKKKKRLGGKLELCWMKPSADMSE